MRIVGLDVVQTAFFGTFHKDHVAIGRIIGIQIQAEDAAVAFEFSDAHVVVLDIFKRGPKFQKTLAAFCRAGIGPGILDVFIVEVDDASV